MTNVCRPLDREIDLIDICKMLIGKLLRLMIFAFVGAVLYGGWKSVGVIGTPDFSVTALLKNMIIGAVLGFLAAAIVFCLIYLFDGKIKMAEELTSLGIPMFGVISVFRKNWLSLFAEKLFGSGRLQNADQERKKLTAKLETTCKNNEIDEILLIGDVLAFADETAQLFSDFSTITVKIAGDVAEDPEAVRMLQKGKNVLMVISEKKTKYAKINETISLCDLQGANLMGYIAFV